MPKNKIKNKEVFVLTGVHGDEKIGVDTMKRVDKNSKSLKWMIANPKAIRNNKRFIDIDLNRCAPGDKNSKYLEKKLAYKIINKIKKYKYVLDIHGSVSNTEIFLIISNPKIENLYFSLMVPIKNVVIWSSKKSTNNGPITKFVNCGLGIECGPKNDKKVKEDIYKTIKYIAEKGLCRKYNSKDKNFFKVYGKIHKKDFDKKTKISDFKKTKYKNEIFYPLLVNQYPDVICYKMEKINFVDLLSC